MTPAAELEGLVTQLIDVVRDDPSREIQMSPTAERVAVVNARAALLAYGERLVREREEAREERDSEFERNRRLARAAHRIRKRCDELSGLTNEERAEEFGYGAEGAFEAVATKLAAAEARVERLSLRIKELEGGTTSRD